jgi:hypothetical protein
MNNQNYVPAGNRIFLLFLALPIFLFTWWLLNYFYALVIGIGSAALLYVLFVWIPADKVQRQLRKVKFQEAKKTIKEIEKLNGNISRQTLKKDLLEACDLAVGLVEALEKESRHQGKVEESIFPLLENMRKQIQRWLIHESGRQPLSPEDEEKLLGILLNYDSLFLKYQEGGLRSDEFLTSLYHTETAMLELGIDINDLEQGVKEA